MEIGRELRLTNLIGLESPDVRGTDASYYVHLPQIAPFAYLHTIFDPASEKTLQSECAKLEVPPIWQFFLSIQNGANLFLNSLYLYGAVSPDRPRNRNSDYITVPFSICEQNLENDLRSGGEWLQVGSYGYNAARLLLSRQTGRMLALPNSRDAPLGSWIDARTFLNEEITRLSALHGPSGSLLVDERYTVPNSLGPM